jgi:uroporphyrin-III C-methyltransferase/precorrin-2 dehydrogenase/sirohydrochlorin ferrochelatase
MGGTLVLMMAVERIEAVAQTLIANGRSAGTPVSVIENGTMPTQRTIYSTLEHVARDVVNAGVRPPALVVIGDVVAVAAELAELARDADPATPTSR